MAISCNILLKYLVFLFFSATIFLCDAHTHHQEPNYMKFVFNASDMPPEDSYDYIIIGGGTAGCPLAATLSTIYRVLVLERGGLPHTKPNLISQEGFITTLLDFPQSHDSPIHSFTSEEGISNVRGRVLGGSSAINAGFYSRADEGFFKRSPIPWDFNAVNESYDWIEEQVVFEPKIKRWQSAVKDGLIESGVGPYNGYTLEHKVGTKIGGSTFDLSGKRFSSADVLDRATGKNIRVAVHASVERILLGLEFPNTKLRRQKAIGVVYRDQIGIYHYALLREHGEVILSAGAIGSPQILLLSGIGPSTDLSALGIPVSHNSPHVGRFLYDNPRNSISFVPSIPIEHSLIQVVGIPNSGAYIEAASTVVPFISHLRSAFIRTPPSPVYLPVATLITKTTGPISSGFLRLASRDVRMNPVVRFNYFDKPIDVHRCVNGTRKIGQIMKSKALEEFKFRNWVGGKGFRIIGPALPVNQTDYEEVADFCRRTVNTLWHYHGGCVVGRVVDPSLRVIGVSSLRVVDGSVFNMSPGTNPQATIMMLGRYMGRMMINERTRMPKR